MSFLKPTFRQFLSEDDEDIVSGIRRAKDLIQFGFVSDVGVLDKEMEKIWKKLSPEFQRRLNQKLQGSITALASDLSANVNVSLFSPINKDEAKAITIAFKLIATAFREVDKQVLSDQSALVTDERAAQLLQHYAQGLNDNLPPDNIRAGIKNSIDILARAVQVKTDPSIEINIHDTTDKFNIIVSRASSNKEAIITGIHYYLLSLSKRFTVAHNSAVAAYNKKGALPKSDDAAPAETVTA